MRKNQAMHTIVVLALDRVMPFELGIPGRVFGSARDSDGRPLYELITCSLDGGPVRTSLDFTIAVEHGPEALARADTIVIPPQWQADFDVVPDGLAEALGRVRPGARMVSICTAAGLFAATGLLDGRPATTHWAFADAFAARFPDVALDPDVLFVDDGDLLTSAGAASGIDLCLHIVRRDHGSAVANRAARACIVPPFRDGGQAQYVERPIPAPLTTTTAGARQWALERLSQTLTLTQLADQAGMSVRTFTRRFREEVGVSPNRWLVGQRVERARELLERSDLGIDAIAAEAGFGSAAALRQQFQRTVGVSPSAYRRAFRAEDPQRVV
jgi:transcriptional regulator GlxA family with amidase domain